MRLTNGSLSPCIKVNRKTKEVITYYNNNWHTAAYVNGYTIYKCNRNLESNYSKSRNNDLINAEYDHRYPNTNIKREVLYNACSNIITDNYRRSRYLNGITNYYYDAFKDISITKVDNGIVSLRYVKPSIFLQSVNKYVRMIAYTYTIYGSIGWYSALKQTTTDSLYNITNNTNLTDELNADALNTAMDTINRLKSRFLFKNGQYLSGLKSQYNDFTSAERYITILEKASIQDRIKFGMYVTTNDLNTNSMLSKCIYNSCYTYTDMSFIDDIHKDHHIGPFKIRYDVLNQMISTLIRTIDEYETDTNKNLAYDRIYSLLHTHMFVKYPVSSSLYGVNITNIIKHNNQYFIVFNNYYIIDIYNLKECLANKQYPDDNVIYNKSISEFMSQIGYDIDTMFNV